MSRTLDEKLAAFEEHREWGEEYERTAAGQGVLVDFRRLRFLMDALAVGIPLARIAVELETELSKLEWVVLEALDRDWSAAELARRMGVARSTVTRLPVRVKRRIVRPRLACACGCGRVLPVAARSDRRFFEDACHVRASRNAS